MFGSYVYFLFSSVLKPIFTNKTQKMEDKSSKQTIKFSGADPDPTFAVHCREVDIISASGNVTNGISRIKSSNIVDYCWEEKFYTGQMLAVHRGGSYVAYGIKGKSKAQCSIRIVNRQTTCRALMRDAEGMIEDLSFGQTRDVLLACVDNTGTLLVYHITENSREILPCLILHVIPGDDVKKHIPYRVFWACSVPEDSADYEDEDNRLLAITRNSKVELWNISAINPSYELTKGPVMPGDVKEGYLVIDAHDDLITEAVFSPDGTAIATASLDGTCKFYQVYMPSWEIEPRCLHQWSPHHGRPVTMLLFLDDLTKFNPEVPFWKYAVTATDNNSELALWSCETWQRLQLIKFRNAGSSERKFKIGIDNSASVMVINDMPNKILYILELNKGEMQNIVPYVTTVTELRLNYPILSFGIVKASIGPHHPNISPALDQPTRINGESDDELGVMIRMYIVQPKSLQCCDIAYPTKRSTIPVPSPVPKEEYENGDCSFDTCEEDVKPDEPPNCSDAPTRENEECCPDVMIPLTPPKPSLNLMVPEAFSCSSTEPEASVGEETPNLETAPQPKDQSPKPTQPDNNASLAKSGGSSPSREVEEILALKNMNYYSHDNFSSIAIPHIPPEEVQQAFTQPTATNRITQTDERPITTGPGGDNENEELKKSLKLLYKVLEKQNQEMSEMKTHISSMESKVATIDQFVGLLEGISVHNCRLTDEITDHQMATEKLLNEKMKAHQEKTEKLHSHIIEKMNSHQEETVSHICQLVDNSITTRLPPMIHNQLHNMITPVIQDLKELMHKDLTTNLAATDSLLRENIAKMVKSKTLIDAVAHGVAGVGKDAVTNLCKESLNLALPKIEQVCSTLMSDMAETFTNGTSQFVSEVESQLKRLTEHWQKEMSNRHSAFLEQANIQMMQMINKSVNEMEDRLMKSVNKTVMKAVNTGVTSRVMTPALGSSAQSEIIRYIEQGLYSEAFQQALSAAELPLVLYVCEKVPIEHVFTDKGSLLSQPVILALIQQLSSDMTSYSKTKHKYLSEAIMNLNNKVSVTREHMPKVLTSLNKQLLHFIANNPGSPLCKDVKMLQMATQSLLNSKA